MLKINKILRFESFDPLDNSIEAANILDNLCTAVELKIKVEFEYDNYVDEEAGLSEISFIADALALKLVTDENLQIFMIEVDLPDELTFVIHQCLEATVNAYSIEELIDNVQQTEDDDTQLAILMYASRNGSQVDDQVLEILLNNLNSDNSNTRVNAIYGAALNIFYGKKLVNKLQLIQKNDENEDVKQHANKVLDYISAS